MKYHCNSVQKRRYSHLLRYSKTSLSLQCSLFQVLPSPCFHLTGSPSQQQMSFRSPRLPDKAHKDWCAFCLEKNMKDQDGFSWHTYRQTDHATDNTDLETFCNKWTGEINLVHRWWVDALLDIIHLGSPSAKNDSLLKIWSIWTELWGSYGCGGWGHAKLIELLTWVLTIWTPCLSARKRYTKRVARMTEVIGAIAGTQKYFLFLFPWVYEISLLSYSIVFPKSKKYWN